MQIADQLRELFLQAVPVVVLVFLFYLFLKANFFGPLEKAMAERADRTAGARKEAEAAQAAALEKTRAYQEALKKARAEVYAEQDVVRRGVLEERAAAVRGARAQATEQVAAAKKRIAGEQAAARAELEGSVAALGDNISEAILKGAR
jgi:F0F1-type ATP synthase membrane subunit b/b'